MHSKQSRFSVTNPSLNNNYQDFLYGYGPWILVVTRISLMESIRCNHHHHHHHRPATGTDIPDPLSPLLLIVHRLWQVFKAKYLIVSVSKRHTYTKSNSIVQKRAILKNNCQQSTGLVQALYCLMYRVKSDIFVFRVI